MRHKLSIQQKLERFESITKKTDYYVKVNSNTEAREQISLMLDIIEEIRTLLNSENQD